MKDGMEPLTLSTMRTEEGAASVPEMALLKAERILRF